MKKLYIIFLLLSFIQFSYAQLDNPEGTITETAETFTFGQHMDENTSYDYTASEYIKLEEGQGLNFEYSPNDDNFFKASNNPLLVFPPEENETGGPPNNNEEGVVGTIPGSFSVSPTGAAIYTIPINLPPGINGMTPKLGLIYNSQNPNSNILGNGWSVAGFSSISRANPTQYYNDEIDNIDFEDDQLILDGSFLFLIEDNNDESVYKTEKVNGISTVTYHKNGSPYPYFSVRLKNGVVKTYGETSDSRQDYSTNGYDVSPVLIWHLNRIEDLYSNYIDFEYSKFQNTGELHPFQITYTGHTNGGSNEKIKFEYKLLVNNNITFNDRKITTTYYENATGMPSYTYTTNSQVLTNIIIESNDEEISKYNFKYEEGSNHTTYDIFLTDIEYAISTSEEKAYVHFNSTHFTWDFYDPDFDLINFNDGDDLTHSWFDCSLGNIDVDGDGKSELMELKYIINDDDDYHVVEIHSPTGGESIKIYTDGKYLTGDYNDDGDEELLIYNDNGFTIYDFIYNSSTNKYTTESLYEYTENHGNMFSGDFNGDGLPDLLLEYEFSGDNNKLAFFLKTEGGSVDFFDIEDNIVPSSDYECESISDFNGDGISDIIFKKQIDNLIYYEIDTYSNTSLSSFYTFSSISTTSIYFNDFNRDGKTDLCKIDAYLNKNIYFSYGSGFHMPSEQNTTLTSFPVSIIDMNNDGMPDFVYAAPSTPGAGTGSISIDIDFGTPDGIHFSDETYSEIFTFNNWDYHELTSLIFADFSGNGNNAIAIQTYKHGDTGPDPGHLRSSVIWDFGISKNLISKFTNGIGKETHIQYEPYRSSYTNTITAADYPLGNYKSNSYLVNSHWVNSGLNKHIYEYTSPVVHREGIGFLGFLEVFDNTVATNSVAHTLSEIKKENNLHYVLYPVEQEIKAGDKVLRTTNTILSILNTETGFPKIYKPYISKSLTKNWDNDSQHSFIKTSKERVDDIDQYGNILAKTFLVDEDELEMNTPDNSFKYETTITSTYESPPASFLWLTNRINSRLTRKQDNDDVNDFDKMLYGYTYNTVNPWQILTVKSTPNDDNTFALLETYNIYDEYGNLTKKTTEAVAPQAPYDDLPIVETYYEFIDPVHPDYFHRFLTRKYQKINGELIEETDEKYEYSALTGNLIKKTDPQGNETHYEYDLFGRLNKVKHPDNTLTETVLRWSNSHPNNPTEGIYYTWSQNSGETPVEVFYDNLQRNLRTITIGFDNEQTIIKDREYNELGLLYKVSDPFFLGKKEETPFTLYTYDELLRINNLYYKGDETTTVRSKKFDYHGRETTTTLNSGLTTETSTTATINVLGRTEKIDDITSEIAYEYKMSGRAETITVTSKDDNSEVITTMGYDNAGNQTSLVEPNAGTSTLIYDAYKRLRYSEDANGNSSTFAYDNLNRIDDLNINPGPNTMGGNINIDYEYYDDPNLDGFGQIKYMINTTNGIRYDYSYDEFGRVISETEKIDDDHIYSNQYSYDIYGRLKEETYPTGYKTTNYYKPSGYLGKIKDAGANKLLWETNEIDQMGNIAKFTLGNNLITNQGYDKYGFLETITTGGGNIQQLEFVFDPSTGNLSSRDDKTNGKNLHESFGYDESKLHQRLISWEVSATGNEYTTEYHDNGNIKTKSDLSPADDSFEYTSSKPHAVTSVTDVNQVYEDFVGNDDMNLFYNALQKTHSVIILDDKKVEFTYGPEGKRKIMQTYSWDSGIADWELDKTTFYALNNLEIEETPNGDSRQLLYIGGIAIQEKINNNNTELFYIHTDYLGNLQAITKNDGTAKQFLSFGPWGRRRDADTWSYNNDDNEPYFDRGYTGHEHLDDFGLINMNGRMYDPWVGRFLSPDPILQQPGNAQNYNRYSYALNNPLKYTDPTGYAPAPILFEDRQGNPGATNQAAANWLNNYTLSGYGNHLTNPSGEYSQDESSGEYYDTGNGQTVSYNEVFQNYISPNSTTFKSFGEFMSYMANNSPPSRHRNADLIQNNLTGNYFDRTPDGKYYVPGTNIQVNPFVNYSDYYFSIGSTGDQAGGGDGLSTNFLAGTTWAGFVAGSKKGYNIINNEAIRQGHYNNSIRKPGMPLDDVTSLKVPKGLKIVGKYGGWAFTLYGAYDINNQWSNNEISTGTMMIEQVSNGIGAIPVVGTGWSIGWNLGKSWGPSTWYGKNDYKWFE